MSQVKYANDWEQFVNTHEQKVFELTPEREFEYSPEGVSRLVYAIESSINRLVLEGADRFRITWDAKRGMAVLTVYRPIT